MVTDKVDFAAEPNFPPTILNASAPVVPIGQTFWIDKSVTSMWSMSVRVRDDNVKQDLQAHWRLVSKDEMMPDFQGKDLTATGDLIRPLPFEVQADSLHDGQCARLELVVSGSFFVNRTEPAYFDATRADNDDSDLAYAFWVVWEGKGAGPPKPDYEHIAASCPTNEKLLMPAMMPTGAAGAATP